MFFIAESIQSFSGFIFYAPKIGDISSVEKLFFENSVCLRIVRIICVE